MDQITTKRRVALEGLCDPACSAAADSDVVTSCLTEFAQEVSIHAHRYAYAYIHIFYTHTYNVYVYIHIYIYIYVYVYIHIYIYLQTLCM